MKSLLIIILATASLIPGLAQSHSGHFIDTNVHSFLHTEHIVVLVLIGLLFYILKRHGNN